jgi:DNA-binding SARP family transcriptional activator
MAHPRDGGSIAVSKERATLDIVDFCQVAPEASGLRCLLVHGNVRQERLMESVTPILRNAHQVILHLKFYPESTNQILSALTKTLMDYNHAHNLLKNELDGTMGAILLSIRRLTRIRITVLVVEGIDVLGKKKVGELVRILENLASERLSVILVSESASPVDGTAFYPYLVDTVTLASPMQRTLGTIHDGTSQRFSTNVADIPVISRVTGITFFGAISVRGPGGIHKLQGQRTKKVLALLVAQALMDSPISLQDFCRIATGEEDDLDRARNMIYIAVHRLRQICGEAAILKTTPVPQLNIDAVEVDILLANNNLEAALSAIREGSLLRAVTLLRSALDIWHGEVLFPGLYDEFFESARDEFEFKLSSAIVKIARSLVAEGDHTQAHSVLELAYPWLKEDKAIGELYNLTLSNAGKFMTLQSMEKE